MLWENNIYHLYYLCFYAVPFVVLFLILGMWLSALHVNNQVLYWIVTFFCELELSICVTPKLWCSVHTYLWLETPVSTQTACDNYVPKVMITPWVRNPAVSVLCPNIGYREWRSHLFLNPSRKIPGLFKIKPLAHLFPYPFQVIIY